LLDSLLQEKKNICHIIMSDVENSSDEDVDFKPAMDVSELPEVVKRRVKALKKVQMENVKLEELYHQQIHALDVKYQKLYDVNNEKRAKIVAGEYEPSEAECEWEEEKEDKVVNGIEKLKIGEGDEKKTDENVTGIPKFWLTAFQNANSTILGGLVELTDEKVLEYLTNVTVALSEPQNTGFVLSFHFKKNPFFTNEVLTKEYFMRSGPDPEDVFDYDGPEITKCKGCKIDWNKGKNVTRKTMKQKEKMKGKGKGTKTVVKLVKAESFFNFFNPPEIPDDDKEEVSDDDRATLVLDYDVGFSIKEKLIPRAVMYFTGEVFDEDDDDEFEDEDTEDDED